MNTNKFLVVLVAVVLVAGASADSWAQCNPGRLFRSSGKLGNNLDFDVTGTENAGNQIGYFWDSDDANNSNSGFAPDYGARCPINQWWVVRTAPDLMKIDGVQGAVGCNGAGLGCPANKMTIVVEDYAAGGPPGVGANAYYAAYLVDETPASGRWYDYGNLDGITVNNAVIPMLPFPGVEITSSSSGGATFTINYDLPDQTSMVHTTDWAGGGMFPTTDVIAEWQLLRYVGIAQPGRARADGWTIVQTTPYVPGGSSNFITLPHFPPPDNQYLAIGIGFNGGSFGVIDSALVGRAVEIIIIFADPDIPVGFDQVEPTQLPAPTQLDPQPPRSGGGR